jgi:succinate-acetate transporter protein
VTNAHERPALDESIARVMVRPIASPLALGFLALGISTFTLAGLELGWIAATESTAVAIVLIGVTAPLQAIAAVYGFLARDAVAATGMGILAATWGTTGVIMLTRTPGTTSGGQGLLLCAAAVAMLVPSLTGLTSKAVAGAVMLTTATRWSLTGSYQLSGVAWVQTAAGIAGLVLAGLALYAAFAFELEDSRRRTILPTLRHRMGRKALEADLATELSEVRHEAGVRLQL